MNEILNYLTFHSPALLIAIPLLGAFLTPLVGMIHDKLRNAFVIAIMLITGFFGSLIAFNIFTGGSIPNKGLFIKEITTTEGETIKLAIQKYVFGGSLDSNGELVAGNPVVRIIFEIDGFSAFMILIAVILPIVAVIYSWKFMEKETGKDKFYTLILLMTVGMLGMVSTGDLFNFFVFLEITSIATAALIAFWNNKKNSVQAAFKYIVISSIGALILLFAVAIFYGQYNALNMAVIANSISMTFLDKIALVLILGALIMKAAIAPLHMWLPDAYSGAPSNVTIVIVGTTLAGLYGAFRVIFTIYGNQLLEIIRTINLEFIPIHLIGIILGIIAIITLIIGLIIAFKSNDLKKYIGYTAIVEFIYLIVFVAIYLLYGNSLSNKSFIGIDISIHIFIGIFLTILAILTIIIGVFMALKSDNFKRMIGYAAVAEIGYMVLAVGSAISTFFINEKSVVVMQDYGTQALTGGIFHMINDALDVSLLFLVAGAVYYATKETSLNKLGGLSRKMKYTTIFFIIGLIAISGLPPLNGFASKLIIYQSTFQINPIIAIVAILCSILLLAVFVKVFYAVFMGPKTPSLDKVKEVPKSMLFAMGIIAALIIFFGLFPDFVIENIVTPAVNALNDPGAYINTIITGGF